MANNNNTTILQIGKVQLPASAVSTVISGLVDVFLLASSTPDLEDYCDIHDKNGKQLWCGATFADVPRAIKLFRDEKDPRWMEELIVVPWDKTPKPTKTKAIYKPLGVSEGLPIAPRDGVTPMLTYTGGDLLLGNPGESLSVSCGAWSASITIELALRHLDDFIDGHRSRLAETIGHYFGVRLERTAPVKSAT